jgi:hypothetical protein
MSMFKIYLNCIIILCWYMFQNYFIKFINDDLYDHFYLKIKLSFSQCTYQ